MDTERIRLTRFCSTKEYEAFMRGDTLHNDTNHYHNGLGGSVSVGFCFTEDPPEKAWKYLKGIVCTDVCMVIDIDRSTLRKSAGKYADYSGGRYGLTSCVLSEYCTREYSKATASLVEKVDMDRFSNMAEREMSEIFREILMCGYEE